jgi:hypothetical protein
MVKLPTAVQFVPNPSEFRRIRSKYPENKILFCNEPVQFVTHALKCTRVRVLYPEGITLFKINFKRVRQIVTESVKVTAIRRKNPEKNIYFLNESV